MEVLDSPLSSQPVSGGTGRVVREAFVTLGYWSLFRVISFSSCDPGNVCAFKNPEVLPRSQVTDLCNCPFLLMLTTGHGQIVHNETFRNRRADSSLLSCQGPGDGPVGLENAFLTLSYNTSLLMILDTLCS